MTVRDIAKFLNGKVELLSAPIPHGMDVYKEKSLTMSAKRIVCVEFNFCIDKITKFVDLQKIEILSLVDFDAQVLVLTKFYILRRVVSHPKATTLSILGFEFLESKFEIS